MPLAEFRRAQPREHIFARFLLALCAAGILLFISSASVKAAWEMYQTFDVAAAERAEAEGELQTVRAEHTQMSATLEALGSSRGMEAAVRERFGFVRPGEGEIRIVRNTNETAVQEEVTTNPVSRFFHALFVW